MEFPEFTFLTADRGPHLRSARSLSRDFTAGRLARLRRGVYVPMEEWLSGSAWTRYAMTTAAFGVLGAPPVFCRETVLSLYGFRLARVPQTVECLTGSQSGSGRRPAPVLYGDRSAAERIWRNVRSDRERPGLLPQGFREARRSGLEPSPLTLQLAHLGVSLPLQNLATALLDTVHRMPFPDAVVIADAIASRDSRIKGPCSLESLAAGLPALSSASARARTASVLDFALAGSESVGESFSRAVIAQLGFEVPEVQFRVMARGGEVARTDFHWRGRGLVGEFDGLMKYTRSRDLSGKDPARVVVEEKLREDRIRAEGYQVVRWIWDDIMRPELLMAKLIRAGIPRRGS
ncbi:hypothetical protein [Arthrobacter sp. NPDC090010]|uniref:hypothetical protein n=1 Tax=Arthrobacter sp. NPDC090010 TaxID=3363942 RepID=UPI00381C1C70